MRIAIFLFASIFFLGQTINAQKTIDVQQHHVAAPIAVRVDGKLQEWSNPLVAENKRTDLAYTIANDDKNIYLALKAVSATAITKIMAGGISFSINSKGKKKENESFVITYPYMARGGNRSMPGQNRQRNQNNNADRTQVQRDSLTLVQRKAQLAGIKEIKISGFQAIQDSLVSIYNEYGIKAKAIIDEQGTYCYELSIPFKQLEIDIKNVNEIAYQIKVNGRQMQQNIIVGRSGGGFGPGAGGGNRGGFGGGSVAQQDLNNPTDFWGKYPLQTK